MRILKELVILALAAIAVLYLINPTAGILEFIPDNLPVVGNIDEAGATLILLNTLRHYGLDLTRIFAKQREEEIHERRTS